MTAFKNLLSVLKIMALALISSSCQDPGRQSTSPPLYYAIEINGILCGYEEVTQYYYMDNDRRMIRQETHVDMQMSIMDRLIHTKINGSCSLDSATGKVRSATLNLSQGNIDLSGSISIEDTMVTMKDDKSGETATLVMPEGTIVENLLYYPHLLKDFSDGKTPEKTYRILDMINESVVEKKYAFEGFDTIWQAGKQYPSIKLSEAAPAHGVYATLWISMEDALRVRDQIRNRNRDRYLAGPEIKKMISTIRMDNVLFYPVEKYIPDFKKMTYMKVKADIESTGQNITAETLNVPGQVFTGTVNANHITGVFTVEPVRYDGNNPPPFPPGEFDSKDLEKYLEPEFLVESNHEEVIRTAQQITEGSPDSWEAVRRLSYWVDKNITDALPGGGNALNTLRIREGECGGHSRLLTAFCRASGIPARLATGCMYISDKGGYFGQHAWTEVWMGEAGWIPVDATLGETDYIDAGHIRLGEKSSFNPNNMEIIEYRTR